MKIFEAEQGTTEWLENRVGYFSASKAIELFSTPSSATYNKLINEVAFGRLTGTIPPSYKSEIMRRGNDLEPEARQAFEVETFLKVKEVGFCTMSEFVGMSPDGLIGEDGLLEIKCPIHTTQIGYLYSKKVPKNYLYQMQFQMMVSARDYCWFYSYYPDFKSFKVRIERDEKIINEIKLKLEEAIEKVQLIIKQLGEQNDKNKCRKIGKRYWV